MMRLSFENLIVDLNIFSLQRQLLFLMRLTVLISSPCILVMTQVLMV